MLLNSVLLRLGCCHWSSYLSLHFVKLVIITIISDTDPLILIMLVITFGTATHISFIITILLKATPYTLHQHHMAL